MLTGFAGTSSPMSFSTRVNGCSPSDLIEEDPDHLRTELAKVCQLLLLFCRAGLVVCCLALFHFFPLFFCFSCIDGGRNSDFTTGAFGEGKMCSRHQEAAGLRSIE